MEPHVARRPVGRPAKVTREQIADAVLEIGLERVTMREIADRLGVSVPGLYHHVRGKADLVRLAAERSMAAIRIPEDHGQHWADWLREWARYIRAALVAEPELLTQLVNGGLPTDRMAEAIDAVLQVLARQGFSPRQALRAWTAVSNCAVGSVVEELRERSATVAGRPRLAEFHRVLAQRPPDELPGLRALVRALPERDPDAEFEDEITTVLTGIAVGRGEALPSSRSRSRGRSRTAGTTRGA